MVRSLCDFTRELSSESVDSAAKRYNVVVLLWFGLVCVQVRLLAWFMRDDDGPALNEPDRQARRDEEEEEEEESGGRAAQSSTVCKAPS
jgi:hypothetical protein